MQGAEPVLENDRFQRLDAVFQRALAVLLPEEHGIGQARANDALVAVADDERIAALDVADGDEVRQQFAVRVQQVEILLVLLHRQDQRLVRHLEELLLEAACHRHRPLDQRRDLVQQILVDVDVPLEARRRHIHLLADRLAARLEARDDLAAVAQLGLVVGRVVDRDGFRCVKTMPEGHIAGGRVQQRALDDIAAVQKQQPVHRAHELGIGAAPAHALRDRQAIQRLHGDLRQQFGGRFALLLESVLQPLALVGLDALELIHCRPAGAGKTQSRFRRVAVCIEGGLDGRAAALDLAVFLRRLNIADQQRQAARRRKRPALAVRKPGIGQTFQKTLLQRLHESLQGSWRQLLGAQFEQQVGGISHWPPPAAVSASGSRAPRGNRSRPGRRRAPGCARAG